ncbi:hypothetical protein AB0D66_08605 [Streptomyces sp. NPDC048270]|uniref:hypothetical protein n=1 Tax=Streptomyces sp. NPDC048270 TaxID=3154615 RepID=UPI0033FD797A
MDPPRTPKKVRWCRCSTNAVPGRPSASRGSPPPPAGPAGAAAPGEGLPRIAARLGISPAEAAELARYWVRKGRLRREEIGAPEREEIGAPECAGCSFAAAGCAAACAGPFGATGPARPVPVAPSPVRDGAPERDRRRPR